MDAAELLSQLTGTPPPRKPQPPPPAGKYMGERNPFLPPPPPSYAKVEDAVAATISERVKQLEAFKAAGWPIPKRP